MLKNKKLIYAIIGVCVFGAMAVGFMLKSGAEVEAFTVKKGEMRELIELQGKVELDKSEKVYSKLAGTIQELAVDEGDTVKEGDVLAQIDATDINYAMKRAEAELKAAQSNTRGLQKSVKPEQVGMAEAQLEQAKAALKAAEKDYDYNKSNLENAKLLYQNGAATQQELKNAEVLAAQAESALESAKQNVGLQQYNLDILRQGASGEAISASAANEEAIRVQIDELKNNAGKTGIYSPIAGTVLSKNVEKGQSVQPGELLYEIGDYASAYIRADVLVDDIAKVKIGQRVIIKGDVVKDQELYGEVYYMAPKAETRVSSLGVEQQRLEVRIRFDNSKYNLKPGYTLDTDIITMEKPSSVYVPDKALFQLDGKDCVFAIRNNKLELTEVKKGIENDDYVELVSGLSVSDKVVVDPDDALKNGMRVKIK